MTSVQHVSDNAYYTAVSPVSSTSQSRTSVSTGYISPLHAKSQLSEYVGLFATQAISCTTYVDTQFLKNILA